MLSEESIGTRRRLLMYFSSCMFRRRRVRWVSLLESEVISTVKIISSMGLEGDVVFVL